MILLFKEPERERGSLWVACSLPFLTALAGTAGYLLVYHAAAILGTEGGKKREKRKWGDQIDWLVLPQQQLLQKKSSFLITNKSGNNFLGRRC